MVNYADFRSFKNVNQTLALSRDVYIFMTFSHGENITENFVKSLSEKVVKFTFRRRYRAICM